MTVLTGASAPPIRHALPDPSRGERAAAGRCRGDARGRYAGILVPTGQQNQTRQYGGRPGARQHAAVELLEAEGCPLQLGCADCEGQRKTCWALYDFRDRARVPGGEWQWRGLATGQRHCRGYLSDGEVTVWVRRTGRRRSSHHQGPEPGMDRRVRIGGGQTEAVLSSGVSKFKPLLSARTRALPHSKTVRPCSVGPK